MRIARAVVAALGWMVGVPLGAQAPSLVLGDGGIEFPDGTLLTSAAGSYANVLVVAKSGGHYSSIQEALDAIGGTLPAADEDNPYLVWVAPGEYVERVTMKPWVDIQGSGEGVTRITHPGHSSWGIGTVRGANDAELRFVTVECTGGDAYSTAVFIYGASPRLTHVTALASGGSSSNHGVSNRYGSFTTMTDVTATASGGSYSYGVSSFASTLVMRNVVAGASGASGSTKGVALLASGATMTNVTASASADGVGISALGIQIDDSSPTLSNVVATATGAIPGGSNYGVYVTGTSSPVIANLTSIADPAVGSHGIFVNTVSTLSIRGSLLRGAGDAIYLGVAGSSATIAHSILDGGVRGAGTFHCFSVCDESLDTLESDCLPPFQ